MAKFNGYGSSLLEDICISSIQLLCDNIHSTKKPVTTMLTYPWKCTVFLHCNHLGNTWKPLVLMI